MNQLDRIEAKLDLLLADRKIPSNFPRPGESVPVVVAYSAGGPGDEEPPPKP